MLYTEVMVYTWFIHTECRSCINHVYMHRTEVYNTIVPWNNIMPLVNCIQPDQSYIVKLLAAMESLSYLKFIVSFTLQWANVLMQLYIKIYTAMG